MKNNTNIGEGPQKREGGCVYVIARDSGPSAKTTAKLKKALAVLLYLAAWSLAVYGLLCWIST